MYENLCVGHLAIYQQQNGVIRRVMDRGSVFYIFTEIISSIVHNGQII